MANPMSNQVDISIFNLIINEHLQRACIRKTECCAALLRAVPEQKAEMRLNYNMACARYECLSALCSDLDMA